MAFTPKNWEDAPSEASPISAAALEDMEIRLATYADSIAGTDSNAVSKSLYSSYGGILSGSFTVGDPVLTGLGSAGQVLTSLPLSPGGIGWTTPAVGGGGSGLPVFNAKDTYGMAPGAGGDQGPELNNALAAAEGAGICYIPGGTYTINSVIEVPSNTHLVGAGVGNTILKLANGFSSSAGAGSMVRRALSGASHVDNVTIEGIEFDGNRANQTVDANSMIALSGTSGNPSTNVHIHHCLFRDHRGLCHAMKWADYCSVTNCTFANHLRDGINYNEPGHKILIANNHIYGCGDDHIAVHGYGTTSAGISRDIVIANNVVGLHATDHAGHGITVSGVNNCTIAGNAVKGGYLSGIVSFNNSLAPVTGLAIVGNVMHDSGTADTTGNAGDGIRLDTIDSPATAGSYAEFGSAPITDAVISGNVIRSPWRHGIRLAGEPGFQVRWVAITGNMLVGAANQPDGRGIYMPDNVADVVATGNLIRGFQQPGVEVGTNCARIDVNSNNIQSCCGTGGSGAIDLGSCVGFGVRGNRVTDLASPKNQPAGLDYGTATAGFVTGNDFTGCADSNTTSGTKGSNKEYGNIGHNGTLYSDAATATALP